MSCQIYVVIYSINSLSVYPMNFRYIFRVSCILKYAFFMYFRVPANLANPIVMYFRVLKYTNNDTRYTKVSCIVYKALVQWAIVIKRTVHENAHRVIRAWAEPRRSARRPSATLDITNLPLELQAPDWSALSNSTTAKRCTQPIQYTSKEGSRRPNTQFKYLALTK